MKMPWYRSLRVRIFLLIIWLGTGTIVILTTYFLDHERRAMEAELQKRGLQLAETLAAQSIEPLLYEDRYDLHELAQTYIQNDPPNQVGRLIQYLVIADDNREVLIEMQREEHGPFFTRGALLERSLASSRPSVVPYDDRTMDISMPIMLKGHRLGTTRLGISRWSVEETIGDLRRKVILYVGIIVLGGIFLGLWLAHRIISPLRDLTIGAGRLADGHWGEQVAVQSPDEIGQLGHALNTLSVRLAQSVAEIQRTQESLARIERLSALGRLSAGLAHEIKNPLTSIKMILQAMSTHPADSKTTEEDVCVMLREIDQMDQIVTRFLKFAGSSRLQRQRHSLAAIVRDALDLMNIGPAKAGVTIHKEFQPSLPRLLVDAQQIKQALVNLFLNAQQAMPRGGELLIRAWQRDTQHVVLEVEDTGEGVPASMAAKVFDPFFTTRESGSGLGLFVAYRIVTAHGGHIELVSPGGDDGALFRITLPLGEEGETDADHPGSG